MAEFRKDFAVNFPLAVCINSSCHIATPSSDTFNSA